MSAYDLDLFREETMKNFGLALGLLGALYIGTPRASADTTSIQSVLFNVNGTQYTDYSAPGMSTVAWNQTTGLGTLTFTYNPGPGSFFFDVFFDHSLNLPFFNEYGTVNGAPAAGQTYQIGDSFSSSIYPNVQAGGALPNTNTLPGQASNFGGNCAGANCNGDAALAMGFSFVLAAGEQEVITLNVSHTNPVGVFNLQQTHPVDPANPNTSGAPLNLYFTGSAATIPACVGDACNAVPEPNSVILLAVMGIVLMAVRRKLFVQN
jgi:PEP-CTERM motif